MRDQYLDEPHDSGYRPVGDYALIGDCQGAALVAGDASIDWCCMPRFDSASVFGRLLDRHRGGYCSFTPSGGDFDTSQSYLEDSMVLVTTFRSSGGEARLFDCFAVSDDPTILPLSQLLRIVEGVRGRIEFIMRIAPRFDYGEVEPWLRHHGEHLYSAVGANHGLVFSGDPDLALVGRHDLQATFAVRAGERVRTSILWRAPEDIDARLDAPDHPAELDRRFEETLAWWRRWAARIDFPGPDGPAVKRSALVLKALTHEKSGAVVAAPTTSLPEGVDAGRNWDYRFSWIRDSQFTVRSLARVGCLSEADGFRRFIQRAAAGSGSELQIMYGVGGERRLTEVELALEGYRGSAPVRIGNAACAQLQLDAYGQLLELTWRWHQRGCSPDDDYWRFLLDLVDTAAERWSEPDHGIWEVRGEAQHFTHSKVECWVALDRGIRLAQECLRTAPVERWTKVRDEIRAAVETRGYDPERGVFTRALDGSELDAALLLVPTSEFVAYEDPRMVRTVAAIRTELDEGGFIRRYRADDGLPGHEGVFLPCSFWLAECLAHQGQLEAARDIFDRALACGTVLGLFSEEYDPASGELLGNFPQGLTHLSHIAAAVALAEHAEPMAFLPSRGLG